MILFLTSIPLDYRNQQKQEYGAYTCFLSYFFLTLEQSFCKQESFNKNISHQLFDYQITFVNSHH